ncbi:hypothetical protein [Streptomyces sp. NPDC001068]|uniref:hypothetical protein n=1 Tax=Streptomyces sp. NPDC001068 TaxID=3364544 RepID=UPI0036824ABB
MSGVAYVIDASTRSKDADVWFALPPGFVALPVEGLTADGGHPAQETDSSTVSDPALRLAHLLLAAGAVHVSLGLHGDDEDGGGPLLSLFTLAWRDTEWSPRSVLAARAVCGLENADHIETLELPSGPASLAQTRIAAPPELGLTVGRQLLQITAYVPCPDGRRIAILSLATTHVERAIHYRALLRDIAGTVSFENPLPDVPDDVFGKE